MCVCVCVPVIAACARVPPSVQPFLVGQLICMYSTIAFHRLSFARLLFGTLSFVTVLPWPACPACLYAVCVAVCCSCGPLLWLGFCIMYCSLVGASRVPVFALPFALLPVAT
jgi:hypothetical protein